jgi:hypothetical protein
VFVEEGLNPAGNGSTCGVRPGWADIMPHIKIIVKIKMPFFIILVFLVRVQIYNYQFFDSLKLRNIIFKIHLSK